MKILITGATGLIGQKLGLALAKRGHEISVISRNAERAQKDLPFPCRVFEGDLGVSSVEITEKIDVVINLLGESVAKRWTKARKKTIIDSRVQGTRHLIASLSSAPQMILSANAIGIYGDQGDKQMTEESSAGRDFLAQVCEEWQAALESAQNKFRETKLASIRIGIVLSRDGGALGTMLLPFRIGIGGAIGDGKQIMSWIHIDDLIEMFCFVIEKNLVGHFNGVAPEPVSNREFSATLSRVLSRPLGPSLPGFVLKAALGEMAQVVLGSTNVSSLKIQKLGFKFRFQKLEAALRDLLDPLRANAEILESEQFVPHKKSEIFEFFAEAKNLEKLTPDTLSFHIKNVSTTSIEQGTLIDYKLKIHGVPMGWRTLIDEWSPGSKFVDIQLKGPYKLWHHTHEFVDFAGGTLLKDRVIYKLPAGYLGWLVGGLFVKADVKKIFAFRRKVIFEKFVKAQS